MPWPPFGDWPPDPARMAVEAFLVLTKAFTEEMAAAAMGQVETRYEEINHGKLDKNGVRGGGIDQDNQGKDAGNRTPNITWEGQVARLMGVSRMIKWRQRLARM